MFKLVDIKKHTDVLSLFKTLRYDSLMDALMKGYHGTIYADDLFNPHVAYGHVGWTYYVAGDVNHPHAKLLIDALPKDIEVLCDDQWKDAFKTHYKGNMQSKVRTMMNHQSLNVKHLHALTKNLHSDYKLERIKHTHYQQILTMAWAKDFVINFKNYEDFKRHGLGFVLTKDNEIIGGVSSYARFSSGYDIEIIVHKNYRKQGLATILGAHFALHCLNNKLIPYWDAAHQGSVALAKKLGYSVAYTCEVLALSDN